MNIDDCRTDPCVNGGRCVDLVSDYKCRCAPGFTGQSNVTGVFSC